MTTSERSSGRPGSSTGVTRRKVPPRMVMARSAFQASAVAASPFWAITHPPTLQKGSVYSATTGSSATARATARSYCSRWVRSWARSSARALMAVTACKPSRSTMCSRKVTFLPVASNSVTRAPGQTNLRGRPGKPAPVPTSIIPAPGRPRAIRVSLASRHDSESRKCLICTCSYSTMAVRLNLWFQMTSSS